MFKFFDLKTKKEIHLRNQNLEFFVNKNREILIYNIGLDNCYKLNIKKFVAINELELNEKNLVYKFHSYATNKFMKVYTLEKGLHIMETYYFDEDTLIFQLVDSPSDFLKYIV